MRSDSVVLCQTTQPRIVRASQDGSVALIFAFSFLAIGGIIGAALD